MVQPTLRFSDRVENYVRYRPGYPAEVLVLLRDECGLGANSVVADIGSGTGILTRMLLEVAGKIFAVEPNDNMRRAAQESTAASLRYQSIAATAEATTLPSRSVDLVTAAQAAHWFRPAEARKEFVRILKPGGWVALIWNERHVDSTPFLREYERLLLTYGVDYNKVRHENITANIGDFIGPSRYQEKAFEYQQHFDYDRVKGRLLSSSYAPLPGDARHDPMLAELRRVFDANNSSGEVVFKYNTRVFYSQLA